MLPPHAVIAVATLLPVSALAGPTIREGEFVRRSGTRFLLGDAPFHFVGANVSVMHGPLSRGGLEATLDAAARDGLAVVRVWAFGEAPAEAPDWRKLDAFRLGPDGWIEDSAVHLDRVIAAARARNLRVILVLANRWSAYGGVPEYLRWAGRPPAGPEATPAELAGFFACRPCADAYRAHARRLALRQNSVTGVRYRDDPTIVAWELMNELSAVGGAAESSLYAWVDEMSRFLHELDPHHLVTAGHIGYLDRRARKTWVRVHRLPGIDYCDSHAYPEQEEGIRSRRDLARWIDDRAQLAHHVIEKPLVWGELGIRTDAPRFRGLGRATWFDAFLAASFRDGVAGALAWIYQPWFGTARDFGIYAEDHEAGRTADVRQVLRRWGQRVLARAPEAENPVLSKERGDAPLFAVPRTLRGTRAPHRGWAEDRLTIDPLAFAEARFEAAGVWREGAVEHLWGAGPGHVEYRFRRPPGRGVPERLVVTLRLSSELPGAGEGGSPSDVAQVTVRLDGAPAGALVASVDDGLGRAATVEIGDPDVLRRLRRGAIHSLRFEVDDGGLCLYGAASGRYPIEPAVAAELPGRVELLWVTSR